MKIQNRTHGAGPRVMALGLDAPNQKLLMEWIESGLLPNIRAIWSRSAVHHCRSEKRYSNEHCWVPLLTGQKRDKYAHWLDQWDPDTYTFAEASIFDWITAPVFYGCDPTLKVIAFDLTAPVVDNVNGIQVGGWATELNESFPQSNPPEVLERLLTMFGPDPKLTIPLPITNGVSGNDGISYIIPSLYCRDQVEAFAESQILSIERRKKACLELIREPWDLFITLFPEIHSAGHVLWHLSQPHPLNVLKSGNEDPLLKVYQAADLAIGEIFDSVDSATTRVLYTADAIVPDSLENARAVFLPEFLYRWNFRGKSALADTSVQACVPPLRTDYRRHWKHEIWNLRTPFGDSELESPSIQEENRDPLSWCPANWYAPRWSAMKAFALPTVADGYIRLNVTGRESSGIVDPKDYQAVCSELINDISQLTNARTGMPIVRDIIQVRTSPFDDLPHQPPADLIVVFHEQGPVDSVESPLAGRIGPVPYFRSANHQSHNQVLENLMLIESPGMAAGDKSEPVNLEDIPATLLALTGREIPAEFDGVFRQ